MLPFLCKTYPDLDNKHGNEVLDEDRGQNEEGPNCMQQGLLRILKFIRWMEEEGLATIAFVENHGRIMYDKKLRLKK